MGTVASDLVGLAFAHLRLVTISLALATAGGVLLGVLALARPAVERAVLGIASLVQAIPGIALLAAMVPLLALASRTSGLRISSIGIVPALVALTLYALLPIVRGLVLGVRGIDRAIVQAAHAVGMTDRQRLALVDLPLAAPSILAGLRTATVWTVGMATLGTPVGATSLGNLIFGGLQTRQYDSVAIGCACAAAIALALDGLLAFAERRARGPHGARVLLVTVALVFGGAIVTGLGGAAAAAGTRPVRIGAKSFTEQIVLSELLRCTIETADSQASVEIRPSLGTTVAFDALAAGDLDLYVEYTGTAWTTILHRTDRAPRDVVDREVKRALAADHHVRVVANLGFENAYALVVRADDPAHSIADLGNAANRSFGGDYEFFTRSEWAALRESYGLAPREKRTMDPSLMYEALATKAVDVVAGYTTDGRIATMNLRALADPKGAIPPYDAIVLVSETFAERHPALGERLARLAHSIDPATMQRFNAAVDGGKPAREVVRQHVACRSSR